MADNLLISTAEGNRSVKTDEDGSSNHYQIIKQAFGGEGTFTEVGASNPLPARLYGASSQASVVTADGALVQSDYLTEAVLGGVSVAQTLLKFGRNTEIDTLTDPEDVWDGGGVYTGQPTGGPEVIDVTSTSANDTNAGTGLQTLRIHGLRTSSSTAEETEDIDMDGLTPAQSSVSWYRVYRAYGTQYGSGGTNAGDITIQHNPTSANIFSVLQTGMGQSDVAAWTVPNSATAYIIGFDIRMSRASGAAGSANVSLRVREFGTGGYNAKLTYTITDSQPASFQRLPMPITLPAQSDVKWRVDEVSDNDTIVTAQLYILVP